MRQRTTIHTWSASTARMSCHSRVPCPADQALRWLLSDCLLPPLDKEGIGIFHLLEQSIGEMMAQEIVASVPRWVKKLLLYGTGSAGPASAAYELVLVAISTHL